MPALTPEDRAALLGPVAGLCAQCDAVRIRHYCRSCDEFFLTCDCTRAAATGHDEHRCYWWTPNGVLAVPDFDNL